MTMIYGRILHRRPFWFDGPVHHEAEAWAEVEASSPKTKNDTLADTHSLDTATAGCKLLEYLADTARTLACFMI